MAYLRKYAIMKNHLVIRRIIANFPMNHSQGDIIREHDSIIINDCQNLKVGEWSKELVSRASLFDCVCIRAEHFYDTHLKMCIGRVSQLLPQEYFQHFHRHVYGSSNVFLPQPVYRRLLWMTPKNYLDQGGFFQSNDASPGGVCRFPQRTGNDSPLFLHSIPRTAKDIMGKYIVGGTFIGEIAHGGTRKQYSRSYAHESLTRCSAWYNIPLFRLSAYALFIFFLFNFSISNSSNFSSCSMSPYMLLISSSKLVSGLVYDKKNI